jgi:predicted dithiol-disulfide oxidoreductase (DUF899 family)
VAVGEADSTVTADGPRTVSYRVAGTAPLERVTVVKNGADWRVESGASSDRGGDGIDIDTWTTDDEVTDDDPSAFTYHP